MRGTGLVAFLASFVLPLGAADVALHGRVVDENDAPVQAAHVHAGGADVQTDPTGIFKVTLPAPGDYLISITREGYYALKDRLVHIEGNQEVTLVINTVREVFQSENVHAETSPVDVGQAQSQERLSGTEVNDMPYANSHSLRNSLQLMPAIVQDASGTLHVNGSSENQVNYLLNGFKIGRAHV